MTTMFTGKRRGRVAVPAGALVLTTLTAGVDAASAAPPHSVNDELVPGKDTDAVVQKYCAAAARVTYQRDILSEHIALVVTGAPDALNWLKDRLAGTPAANRCSTRTVLSSLANPTAIVTLGTVLYNDFLALLGRPIGPGDIG